MNSVNIVIVALIVGLAAAIIMMMVSSASVAVLSEHGLVFIFAIGFIGLVSAREKTPELKA
jgi:hypothetical protein